MFGRATITLGIGPHSSIIMVWWLVRYASRNIISSIMSSIAHLGLYSTLGHRKLVMYV